MLKKRNLLLAFWNTGIRRQFYGDKALFQIHFIAALPSAFVSRREKVNVVQIKGNWPKCLGLGDASSLKSANFNPELSNSLKDSTKMMAESLNNATEVGSLTNQGRNHGGGDKSFASRKKKPSRVFLRFRRNRSKSSKKDDNRELLEASNLKKRQTTSGCFAMFKKSEDVKETSGIGVLGEIREEQKGIKMDGGDLEEMGQRPEKIITDEVQEISVEGIKISIVEVDVCNRKMPLNKSAESLEKYRKEGVLDAKMAENRADLGGDNGEDMAEGIVDSGANEVQSQEEMILEGQDGDGQEKMAIEVLGSPAEEPHDEVNCLSNKKAEEDTGDVCSQIEEGFFLDSLFDCNDPAFKEVAKRFQMYKMEASMKCRSRKRARRKEKLMEKCEGELTEGGIEMKEAKNDGKDLKGRRKRMKQKNGGDSKSVQEGDGGADGQEKDRKKLPNYFLAIKIDDEQTRDEAKKFQDAIVEQEKLFKNVFIAIPTLHITLLVMRINDDEDMCKAKQALQESKEKLQELYRESTKELVFTGLGHFRNKVVFLDIGEEMPILTCLQGMFDVLKQSFDAKGIQLFNDTEGDFRPHATVMKMSKNIRKMKKKGIKKIDNKYLTVFSKHDFGMQRFSEILLCSMLDKKDKDGFYHVVEKIDLQDAVEIECDDQEEGC